MPRVRWRLSLAAVGVTVLAGALALGPAALNGWLPSGAAPASAPAASPATHPSMAEPLDLVPTESLLCWYGRPFPGVGPPSERRSMLDTLIDLGSRVAGSSVDTDWKLWARALEGFNLSVRYPHVLVLIDAQAKPLETNPQIKVGDKIRFALIVETDGQNKPFARVLQAAINETTDTENATQTLKSAGQWKYLELRDQRLPDWCTIAWGEIEQYFVFAVGPEVWPTIAAVAAGEVPALSRDGWLGSVRGQRGRDALIEIIVGVEAIRGRLDPLVGGRAGAFFRTWHADQYERAHWALGFEGSALYCVAHVIQEGRMRELLFADPGIREPRLIATIPEGARYAIYNFPPAKALPRFFTSLLVTRGEADQRAMRELWARIQEQYGFDAEGDILAHLGEHMVMHNYPPHPLHLPLAMTTLTEIRDEPAKVRGSVDALFGAWQAEQARLIEEGHEPGFIRVQQDVDGIWYLNYGLAGPAWTVTDKFIITSWSPMALRMYLDKVGDRVGRRAEDTGE